MPTKTKAEERIQAESTPHTSDNLQKVRELLFGSDVNRIDADLAEATLQTDAKLKKLQQNLETILTKELDEVKRTQQILSENLEAERVELISKIEQERDQLVQQIDLLEQKILSEKVDKSTLSKMLRQFADEISQ
jgi:hypothetical protein